MKDLVKQVTQICPCCGWSGRKSIGTGLLTCPKDNVLMVIIGSKWRIPKKGTKAMKLFLAAMKKDSEMTDVELQYNKRLDWRKVPHTDKHSKIIEK